MKSKLDVLLRKREEKEEEVKNYKIKFEKFLIKLPKGYQININK